MKAQIQTLITLFPVLWSMFKLVKTKTLKLIAFILQLIWIFFLLSSLNLDAKEAERVRVKELFDFDWRFAGGDVAGAEKPGFDDTSWMPVDLPHDFAIYGPFEEKVAGGGPNGYRPLGIGWYRKNFSTPANLAGKKVWLDFEGVYRAPKVWINGTLVAERLNGYVGFMCDITAHLRPAGQTNIVAVRADNSVPQTSRWYTGGGIYRHVWLISTGEVHVIQHGTYVTTPKITEQGAWVNIQTEVKNETATNRWTTLISEILDPDGRSVAMAKAVVPIRSGEIFTIRQQLDVAKPRLWSTDLPALYSLVSRLSTDSLNTDEYVTPFGIREIRITPNGLFLNGTREFARGLCIHHDLGCLGAAAFDRAIERRLQIMKEMGCNAVRLAHNPYSPAILDLCDRIGLLVYDEAFDSRKDQFYAEKGAFKTNWAADLEWFLRRDRNHPSVFIWSVGNEGSDLFIAPDYGADQSAKMVDLVHRIEPGRPVTLGLYPTRWDGVRPGIAKQVPNWRDYPPHRVAFYMDVMSANYMEKHFGQDRLKYPQFSYISSESTPNDNGRVGWNELDREHAAGLFLWGGIDYIGESHKWPIKTWTGGFVELTGFRRPSSYDVESFFSNKPMVYLAIDRPESSRIWNGVKISQSNILSHWSFDSSKRENLKVEAYSNGDEVELYLNDQSLGVRKREGAPGEGPRLIWDVPYAPGTLRAVARNAGKDVAKHELKTAGAPKALRLTPDARQLLANGQDLAHITVEVVDAKGTVVPYAKHLIQFMVTGPGINAGVDNGDPVSDELFQAGQRSVFQGRALLVVRSKRQEGEIIVKAIARGLKPATLTLAVKE